MRRKLNSDNTSPKTARLKQARVVADGAFHMDILDLSGLVAVSQIKDIGSKTYFIEAESVGTQSDCAQCGTAGNIIKSGIRMHSYRDLPIRENRVIISLKAKRLKCRTCGATFVHRAPGMDTVHSMTTRCVEWISKQSMCDTFVSVAGDIGCSEKTVRNIAYDYIAKKNQEHQPCIPKALGIDEIVLGGRSRCVLTDIDQRKPVDLLIDCKKSTVGGWLWQFRKSSRPRVVAIDMRRSFRNTVHAVFPEVPVVVDKFHVLRLANAAVDRVRICIAKSRMPKQRQEWMRSRALLLRRGHSLSMMHRTNLDKLLLSEPDIATAYRLKEDFWNIYDLVRKDEASIALDHWRSSVPKDIRIHFKPLLHATEDWRQEILAYFDHPQTIAFLEALNAVSKAVNKAGRRHSFGVLRAKVLFGRQP